MDVQDLMEYALAVDMAEAATLAAKVEDNRQRRLGAAGLLGGRGGSVWRRADGRVS